MQWQHKASKLQVCMCIKQLKASVHHLVATAAPMQKEKLDILLLQLCNDNIHVRVFLAVFLIGSLQVNKEQMHTGVVAKEGSNVGDSWHLVLQQDLQLHILGRLQTDTTWKNDHQKLVPSHHHRRPP